MIDFRCIKENEIPKFARLKCSSEKDGAEFEEVLKKWINIEKKTKLEWCFIAEEEGEFIGRVFFFTMLNEPDDAKISALYIKDREDYADIEKNLILNLLKQIKAFNFKTAQIHLYSGDRKYYSLDKEIFKECSFSIIQEKKSFINDNEAFDYKADRLTYKDLKEVGKDVYISAIKQVTKNTLDKEDLLSINKIGEEKTAQNYFNLLKDLDYNEEWWKLAYDSEGEFVGLIIPQRFSEERGAINYIGVIPEKRGNNYVRDLLIEGTSLLKRNGIKSIMGDIDINNFPLDKTLNELGYKFDCFESVIKKDI